MKKPIVGPFDGMARSPDPVAEEPLLLPARACRHTGDKEAKRSAQVNVPPVNVPLWKQSIRDQVAATQASPGTASALVQRTRERIEAAEPDLKAWVTLSTDITAQSASVDGVDVELPLRGISLGVKDLIDAKGLPTRAGSPITDPTPASRDAACVARLRSLGAVVQGKTVTTEFGYFAPGPTRNPWALDHTPGGSSSGSAAAVGSGSIPLAVGTQTAGSLTRPASFCGVAGMVLAHGSTDMSGITGLSDSLDSLGLLTRSTDDLRTVFTAWQGSGADRVPAAGADTVWVWHGSELDAISPEMHAVVQQLSAVVSAVGPDCRPLDWDDHVRSLASDHAVVMAHEAADTRRDELRCHGPELSDPLRNLREPGATISRNDHRAALARRDRSLELLAGLLGQSGLIIGPAALGPAPRGVAATGSPILSRPWQLLGLPVVVIPGAATATGLPLGVQLLGLPGREADMLDIAVLLEAALRESFAPSVGSGIPG
jgi:Asp-tRNA(Asn)/Glu-tRNA(Gln) amidotransferase A subunit family amidase